MPWGASAVPTWVPVWAVLGVAISQLKPVSVCAVPGVVGAAQRGLTLSGEAGSSQGTWSLWEELQLGSDPLESGSASFLYEAR